MNAVLEYMNDNRIPDIKNKWKEYFEIIRINM